MSYKIHVPGVGWISPSDQVKKPVKTFGSIPPGFVFEEEHKKVITRVPPMACDRYYFPASYIGGKTEVEFFEPVQIDSKDPKFKGIKSDGMQNSSKGKVHCLTVCTSKNIEVVYKENISYTSSIQFVVMCVTKELFNDVKYLEQCECPLVDTLCSLPIVLGCNNGLRPLTTILKDSEAENSDTTFLLFPLRKIGFFDFNEDIKIKRDDDFLFVDRKLGEIFGPSCTRGLLLGGGKDGLVQDFLDYINKRQLRRYNNLDQNFFTESFGVNPLYARYYNQNIVCQDSYIISGDPLEFSSVKNWSISSNPCKYSSERKGRLNIVDSCYSLLETYEWGTVSHFESKATFYNLTEKPLILITWHSPVFIPNDTLTLVDLSLVVKSSRWRQIPVDPGAVVDLVDRFKPSHISHTINPYYRAFSSNKYDCLSDYVNYALIGLDFWPDEIGSFFVDSSYSTEFYNLHEDPGIEVT